MAAALLDMLDRMMAGGQTAAAVQMIDRAARGGNADALFQLSVWHLIGSPLPRDTPRARALLTAARVRGHVDAAFVEIALTANGSGAPPDWRGAVALLKQLADRSDIAAEHHRVLQAMNLDDEGSPRTVAPPELLGRRPTVRRFPGLLSADECRLVAVTAEGMLAPAEIVDPRTGRMTPNPVRTSWDAVIGPTRENLVVQAINRRLATITDTDVAQGEALSVLRYTPGQQFRPHLDTIAGSGNQRILTVLIYLNEGFGGGATTFSANDLTVIPRSGDVVVFANVRVDGTPDPLSQHAGAPVTAGIKWLATRWIRARPFDVWKGPDQTSR